MISILIPVYNYSIIKLGKELLKQGAQLKVPYEIIIFDDASVNQKITQSNQLFCENNNISYIISHENVGRAKARNLLVQEAKYEWLLFMDSDVIPVTSTYLESFILSIQTDSQVFSGTIEYRRNLDKNIQKRLRWKYGVNYEETSDKKTHKSNYLYLKTANLMVRKSVFQSILFPVLEQNYGYEDTIFGLTLEANNIKLELIENPVYHEGIERNILFLNKTEEAIRNLADLILKEEVLCKRIKVVNFYFFLKKINGVRCVKYLFKQNRNFMKKNLLSENADLKIFQLYKIGYLCYLLA
jgi:glycosyltransferase involved in cell wall biosynthesis